MEQIALLCQIGAVALMCDLLEDKDDKTVLIVLDGIANILDAGQKMNKLEKVTQHVEQCGGLNRIEDLQLSHENKEIYNKSLAILQQYFYTEGEVVGLPPQSPQLLHNMSSADPATRRLINSKIMATTANRATKVVVDNSYQSPTQVFAPVSNRNHAPAQRSSSAAQSNLLPIFQRDDCAIALEENHSIAEAQSPVSDSRPSIGTEVDAIESDRSTNSSFLVISVDCGDNEEAVTVKPVATPIFKFPELSVKMTPKSLETDQSVKTFNLAESHSLEVSSVEKEKFVMARPLERKDCVFNLEPLTALIQPEVPPQSTIPKSDKSSLTAGCSSEVIISSADDLNEIYIQFKENFSDLLKIQKALNKRYTTPSEAAPSIGSFVASIFPSDGGFNLKIINITMTNILDYI